jgi:NitT/TauT family transport system permease protein
MDGNTRHTALAPAAPAPRVGAHLAPAARRALRRAVPLAGVGALVAVWAAVAASGRYSADQLPGPANVLRGARELAADGALARHVGASLVRFACAYGWAVAIALPVGLVLGLRPGLWRGVDPLVQVLRPISPVAWFPLAVLWLGVGNLPAVAIIFIAAFYPTLLATVGAVRRVDPLYLRVARNFGSTERQLIVKVVVPAAFPQIALGLRLASGAAWVYLVAGEMLGAQSGLGFLIVDARNFLRTDLVVAAMIVIGIIGFAIDRALAWVDRRVDRRWGVAAEGGR